MKQSNKKILALSLALFGLMVNIKAQISSVGNGAPGAAADYCGWNATRLFPVRVEHKGNFPINFWTNGVQRMTILGGLPGGATTGFVGVGNNFTTPLNLVDVRDGNINIGQGIAGNIAASPQSYMIGGQNILWHKGNPRNIFSGVGS